MATYSLNQQPYSIQNIGYSDQPGSGVPNYEQPSLYSFLDPTAPVFFGNAASITVNLFGGQWYINMFDTNGSFLIFFMVNRLDYSDADHLVFSDGNFEYVIYDGNINYASPVSIPDDSSIAGDYQPGLVNTAPTDIAGGPFSTAENSANGTGIGTVTGQDPQNDTLTYTLADDAGGRFAIDSVTGELTIANSALIDFESGTTHSVTVRVTDPGGLSFDKVFNIAVTDVNEVPSDIGLSNASIAENSGNGAVVGALTGTDPDAGDTATFTLTDDAGGRFAVSGSNLVVANGALLDFESGTAHAVTVRVTDSGGLAFDRVFNIALTDVNEVPSNIALSNASIAENSGNGTIVGALSDTDPDAGDSATFALTDNAGSRFAVSGSNLVVANGALLDFESNTAHAVTVRVTDSGGLTFDKVFNIAVTNVNEASSNVGLSNAGIAENSANGTIVGALSGTDPDAGDTAVFALIDNAGGRFAVSGSNLVVANGALLDFESNTAHAVTVRVTDSGGLTFDKVFNIAVTNVNEAPSNIALSNASVAEDSANGTVVGALSDSDPDAGDTATFALTDDAGGRFAVSGSNLVVANGALLDFESSTVHAVTVRVTDAGGLTFDKVFDIAVTHVDPVPHLYNWQASGDLGAHPGGYQVAAVGDFNGDGTDDVLWRNPATGQLDEWRLQNGNWSASVNPGTHTPSETVVGIGDFNGDGTDDVLWRDPGTGHLDVSIMLNGQIQNTIDLGSHGSDWKVLGVGDFDHDGDSDILFQNTVTGAVDEWVMANGNWSRSISLGSHDTAYSSATIGDFDGDGTDDVLWHNPTSGVVEQWHMQDGNWAGSINLGSHNAAYRLAAVNDFNGDGTSDVLWRDPTSGAVDGWVMNHGQWFASVSLGSFNPAWQLAGTGDFDHAGGADVLWNNPATGQTGTWLLHAV